jgi:hypothetical protein
MSKTKYEVWRGGRWIELTESLYEFAVNNNHYGRINGVLQHGDPEKKSYGIAAVGVAEYGELEWMDCKIRQKEAECLALLDLAKREAGIPESGATVDAFKTHPACNWPEDYELENGNYINTCSICKLPFKGHKRRVVCRMCDEPNWEELSKIQKPEINTPPMAGCWLQGEMVGFARCMVKRVKPLQEEIARLKSVSPPPQAGKQVVDDTDLIQADLHNYGVAYEMREGKSIIRLDPTKIIVRGRKPPQAESEFLEQNKLWLEILDKAVPDPNYIDGLLEQLHKNYSITRKAKP